MFIPDFEVLVNQKCEVISDPLSLTEAQAIVMGQWF